MDFSINRLTINNFKAFKFIDIEINGSTLTILDGPNGFGKTSFYDAIELLFTGTIKRYNDLENKAIDRRESIPGCPLVYNKAKQDELLSIKAEITIDNEIIFIERYELISELNKNKSLISTTLKLRELKYIDSNVIYSDIKNEQDFIENLLGSNYLRNFHLFHYLEQEENTALLKDKGKSKQEKIAHLFDIGDIRYNLTKIENTKKIISKLKHKDKKTEIETLESEIKTLKEKISPLAGKVEFKKLITFSEQPWDKENIIFDANTYASWINDNGIINQLYTFISNISEYKSVLHNRLAKKELHPSNNAINALIKYGYHIDHIEQYKKDIAIYEEVNLYLTNNMINIVDSIRESQLELTPNLTSLLDDSFILSEYNKKRNQLQKLIIKSNTFTNNILQLNNIRDSYLESFTNYHSHAVNDKKCPTCGFEWESKEELLKNISYQTELFNQLSLDTNKLFTSKLKSFNDDYILKIKSSLEKYILQNTELQKFKHELLDLDEIKIKFLYKYRDNFKKYDIDINKFTNKEFNTSDNIDSTLLLSKISKVYLLINEEKIHDYYDALYISIFSGEIKNTDNVTSHDIKSKKEFIKQQYSQSLVNLIQSKEIDLLDKNTVYSDAILLDKQLTILIKAYKDSINHHLQTISKDIEILFHVYSGRLLQNYQQGLGIFIENKGNSISFKENPKSEHDVIFSMSSGQLSALVISFTLALNKRYAKNNLLLIDDPVQTLDEINISGFVDLLRNEFNNRKIFISTHEDNMSSFIRYKFKKMNLNTNRVNFKEKMLLSTNSF